MNSTTANAAINMSGMIEITKSGTRALVSMGWVAVRGALSHQRQAGIHP